MSAKRASEAVAPAKRAKRLGSNANTVSTAPSRKRKTPGAGDIARLPECERQRMARLRRWELQNHAARLAGSKDRVQHCLRRLTGVADCVEIRFRPATQSARYSGLQTCGSVWHCPICSAKVSEHRRVELARINEKHIQAGGSTWLTTYTIRHKKFNDLADLLKRFLEARRKLKMGRAGQALRREFQIVGTVSVLEVTWSKENGWHPHVHELVFSSDPNFDPVKYDQAVRKAWREAAKFQGLKMNGHGFQIDRTYGAVADYIAKYGHEPTSEHEPWGVESEVTKGHIKRGRMERHLTPFAILDAIADGRDELIPKWQEYARTFKGRKQLNYSPGLKALYQEEEIDDEEIAALGDMDNSELTLAAPSPGQWETVVDHNIRGNLLELARAGRIGDMVEGLGEIGVEVEPLITTGWRVATPAGDAMVLTVLHESVRGRWRCSVLLDQADNGKRWRAFDLVEIIVKSGPSPGFPLAMTG